MKKRTKKQLSDIKNEAQDILSRIAQAMSTTEQATVDYNRIVGPMTERYGAFMEEMKQRMAEDEKKLISLMKKNQETLFSDDDVINLISGSLIRNADEKVIIPKGALKSCKNNGFDDVIKVKESLDRDKIEKWADAKLVLIGAERKSITEFKYDIKRDVRKDEI